MGFLSDSKDLLIEKMLLPILNRSVLQPYGSATKLAINSTAKTIELELKLNDELEPVKIRINNYQLIKEGVSSYAIIRQMETSRAWLTTLAEQHLLNKRLKLPPKAARLLLRLL